MIAELTHSSFRVDYSPRFYPGGVVHLVAHASEHKGVTIGVSRYEATEQHGEFVTIDLSLTGSDDALEGDLTTFLSIAQAREIRDKLDAVLAENEVES